MRRALAFILFSSTVFFLHVGPLSGQNVVHITGTDFVFTAPDTIPEGLTTFEFRNNGSVEHEALLRRIPETQNVRDVMMAYASGNPLTDVQPVGGPDIVDPGHSAREMRMMTPGTYVWICVLNTTPDNLTHARKGMARVMVVKAVPHPRAHPSEPRVGNTLHLSDFAFTFDHPLARGRQWVKVTNDGKKAHEVVIFKLNAGKTLEDVKAWQKNKDKTVAAPFVRIGGLAPIEAGDHAFIWFDGDAGGYVFRCRILDSDSGKTHTQLGMQMEVSVK